MHAVQYALLLFALFVLCLNDRVDTAAPRPFRGDFHFDGIANGNQIIENFIGNRLVKNALVAEIQKVVFQ